MTHRVRPTAPPHRSSPARRAAKRIPKMIGTGRRKRPASIRDKICVLSPISARPTDHGRYEEGFHAGCHGGRAGGKPWHSSLRPTRVQGTDAKGLAKPVGSCAPWPRGSGPPRAAIGSECRAKYNSLRSNSLRIGTGNLKLCASSSAIGHGEGGAVHSGQ